MEFLTPFLPIIIMGVLLYFMIIRPQKKAVESKQNMLNQMGPGDAVITIGGLNGLIDEIDRANNKVILDCEGAYLTFELSSIASVVPSTSSEVVVEEDVQEEAE